MNMAKQLWPALVLGLALCGSSVWAKEPPADKNEKKIKAPPLSDVLPLLDAKSPQALAGVLRGAVLQFLPDPLFESAPNWGHQRNSANQLKWKSDGGVLPKPKIYKIPKNDGNWKKVRLTGNNLADTLILDLRNMQSQPGQFTFDLFLSFDAHLEYDHQIWDAGKRLYGSSIRARFRVKLLLKCEATTKLDSTKSFIPDAVIRLHATGAHLSYDNLVFEHVAGMGGAGARVLGRTFHNIIKDFNPDLERRMLDKAANAIVKAADTKEVRLSLNKVFGNLLPAGK